MPQFLLLLRDNPEDFSGYSGEEMQKLVQKYRAWRESLGKKIAQGHKLKDGEGRVVRRQSSKQRVTDGPFAEGKEVMGGFFLIEAGDYDEAVKIASTCPHVQFGSIEVRAIEIT